MSRSMLFSMPALRADRLRKLVLIALVAIFLITFSNCPSQAAETPGNFIYVTNGTSISAYAVAADGTLNEIPGSPFATGGIGGGLWAVADQVIVSPSGKFLYIANSTSNNISGFSVNPVNGKLTPIAGSPFAIPRHPLRSSDLFFPRSLAISRDERFIFVASDSGQGLTSFSIAPNGALTNIQSAIPYYQWPTRMRVSNDGKHLFAGQGFSEAVFAIDIDPSGEVLGWSKPPYTRREEGGAKYSEMNCARSLMFVPDDVGLTVLKVSPQADLTELPNSPFQVGVGTDTHIVINPANNILFTADERTARISSLKVTPDGNVSLIANSTRFIGDPNNEDRRPLDIQVSADGRWVYAVSGDSTIFVFSVGPDGLMTPVIGSPFYNRSGSSYGSTLAVYPPATCGPTFDLCLQDDSSNNLLQINTTTGEYQFSNCAGVTIGGTGAITQKGNSTTFQQSAGSYRVLAKIDGATKKATASIQVLSTGRTYSITDRDTTNNTCACK